MPPRYGIALALGLAAAFGLCLGPIQNPDLPWHLAAGRWMAENVQVPRQDCFSWTKAGTPWIDFEWGSQLAFYALYRAGGNAALWLFKAAGFFSLALLLLALLRAWGIGGLWPGLAAPAFMAALLQSQDVRPELFSLMALMLQLFLLERRRLGLPLPKAPLLLAAHAGLYAAWANLHSGFPTGLGLCAVYAAADLLPPREPPRGPGPMAWAAAGLLGTFLNPWGLRLYAVFADHWEHRALLRELVMEWGRPRIGNIYQTLYWLLIAFSFSGFLLAAARGEAVAAEHAAAAAVFGLFSSLAFRTTAYATILVFPLGLRCWHAMDCPPGLRRARAASLAAALAFLAWRAGIIVRHEGFLRTIAPCRGEPAGAAAFLRAEKRVLSGLNFYNPYDWGGYLDWALFPDYKVFMDGRYIFIHVLASADAALSTPVAFGKFLDRRGIDLALISNDNRMTGFRDVLPARPFAAYAMPGREWALLYWDSLAEVLVRRSKAPPFWLASREYKHLKPRDLRTLGLRVESGEVRLQEVEAEIGRYKREIGDPRESLRMEIWLAEFKKGLIRAGSIPGRAPGPARRPGRLPRS
jgi:hypothetical protein